MRDLRPELPEEELVGLELPEMELLELELPKLELRDLQLQTRELLELQMLEIELLELADPMPPLCSQPILQNCRTNAPKVTELNTDKDNLMKELFGMSITGTILPSVTD